MSLDSATQALNRTELSHPGDTMTDMATHKRTQRHAAQEPATPPRSHDRAAAWLVAGFAGITMVAFNMWHAIHGGIPIPLAVLFGLAPVVLAMGLSHVVAAYQGGWFMKGATFAIMLGAMVLSIRATGYVVRPATGNLWPLFGIVTDSAALLALQVIMSPESRAAAKAARKEPETDEQAELRAALETECAAREAAEAALEAARNEAAEAAAKGEILTRKLAAVSARNARAKKAAAPRSRGAASPATEVPNDVDAQAEALAIISAEPGIKGAKLGPRVGKSERWGQLFMQRLATAATDSKAGES